MKSLFSQLALVFPQFWVFEAIFEARGENNRFLKTPFVTLIVLKTTASIPRFQCKNRFENGPPWAEILAKMFLNMACQTKPWPHFVFSQLSRPRVVRFSNRFLHWNRGIETVVLSTIKGTNGVFKNPKIFPASLKNRLKNPKLRENLTWLGKMAFHLGICDS